MKRVRLFLGTLKRHYDSKIFYKHVALATGLPGLETLNMFANFTVISIGKTDACTHSW